MPQAYEIKNNYLCVEVGFVHCTKDKFFNKFFNKLSGFYEQNVESYKFKGCKKLPQIWF